MYKKNVKSMIVKLKMNEIMKVLFKSFFVLLGFIFLINQTLEAQDQTPTKSLNSALDIYVFPAKDQSPDQQAQDEADCYSWAVEQSGVDPLNLPAVEVEQAETGPDGSAVGGAAVGAAKGAAIGAIAGDAGKGAAIGAAAGAMRGNRHRRMRQSYGQAANEQEAIDKQESMIASFKKAYSACLEGKGYTVK
jgi:hypothetical protein